MPALFQLYHDLGDHRDIETCRNDFVGVREHLARRIAEQNPCVIHDEQAVSDLTDKLEEATETAQQPRKVFEAAGVGRMMTID